MTRTTPGLINARGHRADEARRHAAQRRPRRDPRRAGRRRRPARPAASPAPASTCSRPSRRPARRCSTRRTRCSPRTSARRRPRPRSRSPRRSPSRSSRSSTDGPARYAVNAPLLTPETAQAIAPYLPLAETLGRFLGAVRPRGAADADARDRRRAGGATTPRRSSRRCCAGCSRPRRPERVNLVNAGDHGPGPRDRGRRAQDARRAAPFSSLLTVTAEADGRVGDRRRAPSPTASRTSSGSTSTRWTSRRRTRC